MIYRNFIHFWIKSSDRTMFGKDVWTRCLKKMFGKELFAPPYSTKIIKVLPTLFNMVELENRRGNKLGMEVGTARERVIIALFMLTYGDKAIQFPESTAPEMDVIANGEPISIKTKTGKGFGGVKLSWTTDWKKVDEFAASFVPASHLLFINILWGGEGGFYLITRDAQRDVLATLGRDAFFKLPKRDTNPRGIELSAQAMRLIQDHKDTQTLMLTWRRDPTLLLERTLYNRWLQLWDTLG